MSKKKHHRVVVKGGPAGALSSPMDTPLFAGLRRAARLMEEEDRPRDAMDVLRDLDSRYPNRPLVLQALSEVGSLLGLFHEAREYAERLGAVAPDDADAQAVIIGAYARDARFGLALNAARRFASRWPDHPEAARIRQTAAAMEAMLPEYCEQAGIPSEGALETLMLHDRTAAAAESGRFEEAERLAGELLERTPNFTPGLNNLSMAYWFGGRIEEALATARRALAIDPDNVHALSNVVRYLFLLGRVEEASRAAREMGASRSDADDRESKMAEALSLIGDDAGVWRVYEQARPVGLDDPLLVHLAAAAAFRLGREKQARAMWEGVLTAHPEFEMVQANLDDLQKPPGERHAPWAYDLPHWLPRAMMGRVVNAVEESTLDGDEEAMRGAIRRELDAQPGLRALVPLLLERGDPKGRELALTLALQARTPQMLAALRDFAVGRWGPDQMRMEAGRAAAEAGLLPREGVAMWWEGEQRKLSLLGWEIYTEGNPRRNEAVQNRMQTGIQAMRAQNYDLAEQSFTAALDIEPNAPDILNNLAATFSEQGRSEEATALFDEIEQKYPDYLMGRINRAHRLIGRGELDAAQDLLNPVVRQPRLHVSEFIALANAYMRLYLARGEEAEARRWLEMWEEIAPDSPGLERAQMEMMLNTVERRTPRPGRRKKAGNR